MLLYAPEATPFNVTLCIILLLSGYSVVSRELSPKTQLSYSKFSKPEKIKESKKIDSRRGMLVIYSPSVVVSMLLLFSGYAQQMNTKVSMLLLAIHYLKRVYEVLYVHRYSGLMKLTDGLVISSSYFSLPPILCYLANQVPANYKSVSLTLGVVLFLIGESMNHYHHIILSSLRTDKSKEYKIPNKGLFRFIWCPHYLGEITAFAGLTFASLNYITCLFFILTLGYLSARSYNTRKWYQEKFKVIPHRYCLIPGIF